MSRNNNCLTCNNTEKFTLCVDENGDEIYGSGKEQSGVICKEFPCGRCAPKVKRYTMNAGFAQSMLDSLQDDLYSWNNVDRAAMEIAFRDTIEAGTITFDAGVDVTDYIEDMLEQYRMDAQDYKHGY